MKCSRDLNVPHLASLKPRTSMAKAKHTHTHTPQKLSHADHKLGNSC